MKKYLIVIGLVLLALSLFGVVKTFSTPTRISTVKPVKVLEYQQEGVFDYVVTAKPVYFYADARATASEVSPQIPVKFIEKFNVRYSYISKTSANVDNLKINAILESPGAWKKTINLIPQKTAASVEIPVDLKYFQDLADTIEKEIGASAASHDLTLQAVVSGSGGSDFVQLLPIKMSKVYVKISDTLTSSGGGREGRFDYAVKLAENSLFGPVTLKPPAAAAEIPAIILGPKDTIFTKFIDSMVINYSYNLTSAKALSQPQVEIIMETILENPENWSKTYTLVAPTRQNGAVSLSFPLDLKQYTSIFDTIQQETDIAASTQNLTLKATLHTIAQTSAGPIDKTFTQSIKTNLREGLLTWSGDLKKTLAGAIETPQPVIEQSKIMGLPVLWLRIISAVFAALLLAWLVFSFLRRRSHVNGRVDSQNRDFFQKYKDMVIDVNERPETKPGQTVLTMDSPQHLIKVAQGLLKPVNHAGQNGDHLYWVNDESTRYEYRTGRESLPSAMPPQSRRADN